MGGAAAAAAAAVAPAGNPNFVFKLELLYGPGALGEHQGGVRPLPPHRTRHPSHPSATPTPC